MSLKCVTFYLRIEELWGLGTMCRGVRRVTTVTPTCFFSNGNTKKMDNLLEKALKEKETLGQWFLDSSFIFKIMWE